MTPPDLNALLCAMNALVTAINVNSKLQRAGLRQIWKADQLEDRYSMDWREIKQMFMEDIGLELGDRRTARVRLERVLELDDALRDPKRLQAARDPRKPGRPRKLDQMTEERRRVEYARR